MSNQKVINVEMHWAETTQSGGQDVLTIGGITPGGKSVRVMVKLGFIDTIGYLGGELHKALKVREQQIASARRELEGKP